MKLEENEYTIKSLIKRLNDKYTKSSGEPFTNNDICQYRIRGYLPYKYGGELITEKEEGEIKIIVLNENKTE